MSEEIGAGASALDAGVSVNGLDPFEIEVAAARAREVQTATDAVERLRAKVVQQERHLAEARQALADAEAALTGLEG